MGFATTSKKKKKLFIKWKHTDSPVKIVPDAVISFLRYGSTINIDFFVKGETIKTKFTQLYEPRIAVKEETEFINISIKSNKFRRMKIT